MSTAAGAHADPGLRFWLGYADAGGGLAEDRGDHTLVLLPAALRAELDLPEMVAVTAEPEVAREDGALLLLPGNPLLDATATRVVEEGDAGHAWVLRRRRPAPSGADLARRARESVAAEHGRIDRDGPAGAAWLPVLRVGAVVATSASLDLRFQERHEAWVDARTGLELPEAIRDLAAASPWSESPDERHRVLPADLPRALRGAHRLLTARAEERAAVLAAQAAEARTAELERVEAYYRSALAALVRRREAADDDRRGLLDARADATRDERERRRREIEDSYRMRHELRPFRLHLMFLPAVRLPVVVRRGARTFPLELVWLADTRTFAPVACPHCGRGEPLVAGRQRLGCAACLPRPVPDGAGRDHAAGQTTRRVQADTAAADERGRAAAAPSRSRGRQASARTPPRRDGELRPRSRPEGGTPPAERVQQVGDRLARRFWQDVAEQRRWHRRKVAPDTPLHILHRVCGRDGPLVAIGATPGEWVTAVEVATADPEAGRPHATVGAVVVGRQMFRFALRWELDASGPALLEVLPGLFFHGDVPPRWALDPTAARQLFAPTPPPPGLDPVAAALWVGERPVGGLALVVRCLTAWGRAAPDADPAEDPATLAAAVASLVAGRSGIQRPRATAAADYGADPGRVAAVARSLQRRLRLSSARPW